MYAFGAFELDPLSHELRRSGVRIKIQDQPFLILVKLLEHPGQVVTRDELRSALWHDGTFVDFDTSLNSAVKRLREALGDSVEAPQFIESLPKLGYRFVAPVEVRPPGLRVAPWVRRDLDGGERWLESETAHFPERGIWNAALVLRWAYGGV